MTTYAAVLEIVPSFGWTGGPTFNTEITSLRFGQEIRNARWSLARHRFRLPLKNIRDDEYLQYLKSVFLVVKGQTGSFLALDRSDYTASGESLGNAPSGTTAVQLVKNSAFGVGSYVRTITKPRTGTVTVYQNGSAKAGSIDTETGLFTPSTSWTEGQPLTADFQFYVPVRFASDLLEMSIDNKAGQNFFMNGSVDLIEVLDE